MSQIHNIHPAVSAPSMNDLFVDPRNLPTPPIAVLEIMRRADDPDVALADIVTLIESEVSIAVQVLRMANSALYAPVSEITTIGRAMTTLGLRTIRLLALTTSLRTLIPQESPVLDTLEVQQRMVINGALARDLAARTSPAVQDEAFLAGLLTGIGPIVLAMRAPEVCSLLTAPHGHWPTPEREREVLGYAADDVTAALLERWGLPGVFADVIGRRGTSFGDDDDALSSSVKAAMLAERVLTRRDPEALVDLREILASTLGMNPDEVDEWLVASQSTVDEVARLLQIRVPTQIVYAELLSEVSDRIHSLQESIDTQMLHGQATVADLARRNDQLEAEVLTDSLTQLPNRRAFDQHLSRLLSESTDGSRPGIGVLMIDIDRFKAVNDSHGHGVGDDVLRLVGGLLQRQTRGDDFAARRGGEEFVMFVADTTRSALFAVGERLRLAIADLALRLDNGSVVRVTTSIGGAVVDRPIEMSARELVEAADRQLYEAKRRGRNCTQVA